MPFEYDKIYLNDDPDLDILAAPQTRARWRCEGQGPAFVKLGRRVAYLGRDLISYVERRRVSSTSQRPQG